MTLTPSAISPRKVASPDHRRVTVAASPTASTPPASRARKKAVAAAAAAAMLASPTSASSASGDEDDDDDDDDDARQAHEEREAALLKAQLAAIDAQNATLRQQREKEKKRGGAAGGGKGDSRLTDSQRQIATEAIHETARARAAARLGDGGVSSRESLRRHLDSIAKQVKSGEYDSGQVWRSGTAGDSPRATHGNHTTGRPAAAACSRLSGHQEAAALGPRGEK